MMKSKLYGIKAWARSRSNGLAGSAVFGTFIGVMAMLFVGLLTTQTQEAPKPKVIVQHVLDSNFQQIPTVPTECLTALEKADIGYSYAYNAALRTKSLSRHDRTSLQQVLDKQAHAYEQYREMCYQMANNG